MHENKEQLIQQINAIISEHCGIEPEEIDPHSEFLADYNVDFDSLSLVAAELEHQFAEQEVVFDPDEIAGLTMVKDLYDLTFEKLDEV